MGRAHIDKLFMSQPTSDLFMKLLAFNFSVAQDANIATVDVISYGENPTAV